MDKDIWHLEEFDFYKIICPYKLEDHVKMNPPKIYLKNEFVFMEEDRLDNILLIDHGKVKIGHYDEWGNENVLIFLGKGEIMGQMALVGQTRHHAFAEVMEDGTQICKMSVVKARELTRDYVPFCTEMNRRINGHVRKLERRIEILLFKNVKIRLIEFLKDLACEHGQERECGLWIEHSLTQNDIALLIGTSRKSASLLMNELEDQGFISFGRKYINIPNLDKLKDAATNPKKKLS